MISSTGAAAGVAGVGCVRAGVEKQKPGARVAGEDGFNALAIEPAGGFDGVCAADGRDVGVDEAAEAMGDSGGDASEAGACGGEDDGGCGGAAEGFAGGGVGCIARLGEGFAGDGQQCVCGRQTFGQVCRIGGDDADGERRAEAARRVPGRR